MLSFKDALGAAGLGAGVGDAVLLAVEADDEHGTSVHVAARLVWDDLRRQIALRIDVADAFSEAAPTELVGAAEEVDGVIGVKGSDAGLHGAIVLLAEG